MIHDFGGGLSYNVRGPKSKFFIFYWKLNYYFFFGPKGGLGPYLGPSLQQTITKESKNSQKSSFLKEGFKL